MRAFNLTAWASIGSGWSRIELPDGGPRDSAFPGRGHECEVWLDGKRVGTHLGRLDAFPHRHYRADRSRTSDQPPELVVRVDEKVGHNSQGFLPIVAPHFGGIWQDVSC